MKCPNCKAKLKEGSVKCSECGYELAEKNEKKKSFFSFGKSKNDSAPVSEETAIKSSFKLKIIIAFVILIVVAVIAAVIVSNVNANRGRRLAENLSEAIGRSIVVAEKNAKVELIEESASAAANKLLARQGASYLYESSNEVKVDGVHYPKWIIYVSFDDESDISKVEYFDFGLLEDNYKGEKTKAEIDTSQIVVDDKKKDVENLLKIEPTMIEYTADTIKCCYNYYFINDDGDEEARAFYIVYSADKERVMQVYRHELGEEWCPRYLF